MFSSVDRGVKIGLSFNTFEQTLKLQLLTAGLDEKEMKMMKIQISDEIKNPQKDELTFYYLFVSEKFN